MKIWEQNFKKDFVLDEQQNVEKRNKIKINSHFRAEMEGRIEEKTQIILDEYQMKWHKISIFYHKKERKMWKRKKMREKARKKGCVRFYLCQILKGSFWRGAFCNI